MQEGDTDGTGVEAAAAAYDDAAAAALDALTDAGMPLEAVGGAPVTCNGQRMSLECLLTDTSCSAASGLPLPSSFFSALPLAACCVVLSSTCFNRDALLCALRDEVSWRPAGIATAGTGGAVDGWREWPLRAGEWWERRERLRLRERERERRTLAGGGYEGRREAERLRERLLLLLLLLLLRLPRLCDCRLRSFPFEYLSTAALAAS